MSFQNRRWYPYFAGVAVLTLWLLLAALPQDYPSWRQGLVTGVLTGALTCWIEGLRRGRRLRGQEVQNMGTDYRA